MQEERTSLTLFVQTFCLLGVNLWQDINKKTSIDNSTSRHLHAPEKWFLNHISPNKNSNKKKRQSILTREFLFASPSNGWAQHLW